MYFAFDIDTYTKNKARLDELIDKGVGIIAVSENGLCTVKRNAKKQDMKGKKAIVTSLAWKSGYSKATVKRFHSPKL